MDPKERPNSFPKYRKYDANGMTLEINKSKLHSIYPTFTLHSCSAGKHLVAQSASRGQIGRAKWERGPLKIELVQEIWFAHELGFITGRYTQSYTWLA